MPNRHWRATLMTRAAKIAGGIALLAGGGAAVGLTMLIQHGFSARDQPTALEAFLARRVRRLAIPLVASEAKNPIASTPEILVEARAHFADHCANCHANDGSGKTGIGRNLYPKAPDMRAADTQSLTDGEIFYIIHNGIRLTGMPAWGGDDAAEDQDSWKLVHFIRHLPKITSEEIAAMKTMNPKTPDEMDEEKDTENFLRGDDDAPRQPHQH